MNHERTNILHIIESLDGFSGGPIKIFEDEYYQSKNFRWFFICLERLGYGGEKYRAQGFDIELVKRNRFDPRIIYDIVRFIKKNNISVVCTHFLRASIWGRIAAILAQKPSIMFEHGIVRHESFPYLQIDRFLSRFATLYFANSNTTAKHVMNILGVQERKIRIGYPHVTFKPKSRVHRNDNVFLIGNVAGLNHYKGHDTLLYAFKDFLSQVPNSELHICGDGPLRSDLDELSRSLHIESNVTFHGKREDINDFLAQLDLYVFPSVSEGFGIAVVEAMLTGLPVICSDADALPEVIEREKTGLIFSVNSRGELTKAIERLYENRDLAQRLASNAQKEAVRRFCEENKNDLLNVYQEAIDIYAARRVSQKDRYGKS